MIRIALATVLYVVLVSGAEARYHNRHHYHHHRILATSTCVERGSIMFPSCMGQAQVRSRAVTTTQAVSYEPARTEFASRSEVVGGRPSGCPHAFCGCGASLHVFGRIIPSLNLAANWLRFPRTSPAPGMVAARRGHVFVLEQSLGNGLWLVHDSNSGRGLTRLHARSLAGYAIVNPHGGSV